METRQSLRIPLRRALHVELRTSSAVALGSSPTARHALAATSTNVSRGGVALEMGGAAEIQIGAAVRVTMQIGGRNVALPGHVVWTTRAVDSTKAGIKLLPQVADSNTRRSFETFMRDAEQAHLAAASRA